MLPTHTSKVPSRALRAMFTARYAILVTTILLTSGLAFPAALYPKGVTQDTIPPANSPSAIAKARYDVAFPGTSKMTGFVVFLTNTKDFLSGVNFGADMDMMRFDYHLEYFTFTGKIFSEEYVKNWVDPLVWPPFNKTYPDNTFASFRSTMFLSAVNLTVPGVIARTYLTPGNISCDILLGFPEPTSSAASTTFYRKLDAVLPKLMKMHNLSPRGAEYYVVGLPAFMQAVGAAVTDDITRMFSVVVPIALLVFGVSLSSARLLVLPAASLCVSLMTTMAIMCLVTETMSVNSMSPGIALMMGVALTFDYAYFWASQYRRIMVEHVERNGGQWGELKIRPGSLNPYREKRQKKEKKNRGGERASTAALLGNSSPTQYTNGGTAGDQEGTNNSGNPSSLATIGGDGDQVVVYGGGSGRNDESIYNPNNVDDEDFLVDTMKQLYMTAGKTIVISSITCALCSVGVVFFNVDVIQSIGVTAVVTSLCVGITCLIVPATLIMAFPNFFFASLERWFNAIHPDDCYGSPSSEVYKREQAATAERDEKRKAQLKSANATNNKAVSGEDERAQYSPTDRTPESQIKNKKHVSVLLPNGVPGLPSDDEGDTVSPTSGGPSSGGKLTKRGSVALSNYRSSHMILRRAVKTTSSHMSRNWSIFFNIAERFVSLPNSILILIFSIGLIITPTLYAFHPTFSNDIEQFVPRSAPILNGWNTLQKDFPPGLLFTYFILVEFPTKDDAVYSYPYHHELIATLLDRLPNTRAGNFDSQAFFGVMSSSMDPNITLNQVIECIFPPASASEFCHYLTLTGSIFQNPAGTAQYIQIKTDFDPTKGNQGREWHRIAVDTIQEFQDTKLPVGWTVSLKGYAAETFDTIEYAESALALILACDACIVAFMVFLTFGSVIITLRMCLTVFLTVGASMGLTTLVYCNDSLNNLGWNALSGTGSLAWQVPFASILISFGIAFNYELIVITKIVELRWKAFDTKHSIIAGLAATGREVSVAALIMLIVFFGFVISDVPAMNELGFIFMITAFIGAFFVRIFTVPSAMGLLGHINWFPLQYCPARFIPPVMMNADSETDSDGEGRAYYPAQETTTSEGSGLAKRQSYHRPHPTFTKDEDVAAERAYEAYRGSLQPTPNASFTGDGVGGGAKQNATASLRGSYNTGYLQPPGEEQHHQHADPLYRNATLGGSFAN